VIRELEEVNRLGFRKVFLADDNFTIYRSRAKELLQALRAWNDTKGQGGISFNTQVSIDAAKDQELLRMCAEAGLTRVFIGIETPNTDSLHETKKHQNTGIDLVEQVLRFLDEGIAVSAGMIVGFDADGPDIFERQYQFAMSAPIPIFSVGTLVAPAATPLHARMKKEGRLVDGGGAPALPYDTNIRPRQMTREQLLEGLRSLCYRLYMPSAFAQRVLRFIRRFQPHRQTRRQSAPLRAIDGDTLDLVANLPRLGPEEEGMFATIRSALQKKPEATEHVFGFLQQYLQIRHMYDQWNFWPAPPWSDGGTLRRGTTPAAWP
jgi:radical SAM superfamily enzyme YgiQ (UPF0313 family)